MNALTIDIQIFIAHVVELRLLGRTWTQLATELHRSEQELRALPFQYPQAWRKQMNTTSREALTAGVQQALATLSTLLQHSDAAVQEKAAATLARLHATQERTAQRLHKARTHKMAVPTPPAAPNTRPQAEQASPVTPPTCNPHPATPHSDPIPVPPTPAHPNTPARPKPMRRDANGIPLLC